MPRFVVWPCELDSRISRRYGRIVPKTLAIEKPSVEEIVKAVEVLGFKVIEVEMDKLNPRLSGIDEELRTYGRVIIESPYGKGKTLKIIAQKVRELRKGR
ncbi:signal recognition particle protein Srp19 [Pyrococcus sp. NA2]|uniref:signal recognition particle protein Srp19 n=1 Tax=Pyrococcus sp. (strain NA2) TaxID=342949 RepID=UPI000209AA51|nr:signal recognition particle protein Srp19 [Pyrococcus sp. NA2]AEC51370.1 signal recognition particle protein Srp19 [Pyrococcus sp. NA2]